MQPAETSIAGNEPATNSSFLAAFVDSLVRAMQNENKAFAASNVQFLGANNCSFIWSKGSIFWQLMCNMCHQCMSFIPSVEMILMIDHAIYAQIMNTKSFSMWLITLSMEKHYKSHWCLPMIVCGLVAGSELIDTTTKN